MNQQINGMVIERLVNCDTHFDYDQLDAIMNVLEDSGYSDLYEALKDILNRFNISMNYKLDSNWDKALKALAKAESK